MASKLNQYTEKFDALPVRTRLVLTFAAVATLLLVFQLAWYGSVDSENKKVAAQTKNLDQQILEFTRSQQEINSGVYQQRHDPKRVQLEALQSQVDEVQQELERKTLSLVRPEAMAQLLKQIIDNSKNLKLISLKKETPVALFEEQGEQQTIQMYRHPLAMVFEGGYSDTQKFLQELENMQRKVNFERFEFSVESYPKSTVTLVVSTYSTSRKWIGG
jgi:MSHA biogenesis protein MshJ